MYRKMLIIIAMLVAGGTALAPSVASARGGRGGGGRGYSRGGRGWGWGGAAIGLGIGLGAAGYYGGYAPYGYYGGCWRRVIVDTPYGPRSRRVWVC